MVETSTNVPNNPDRRGANGQAFATRAATAPLSTRAGGLALDADLIGEPPTTGEDVVRRRSAVMTEIETPEPGPQERLTPPREAARRRAEYQEAATTPKEK